MFRKNENDVPKTYFWKYLFLISPRNIFSKYVRTVENSFRNAAVPGPGYHGMLSSVFRSRGRVMRVPLCGYGMLIGGFKDLTENDID